ncbi:YraN family protein [Oscillospiraceae bacterium HV4-5-C5C]|nr:YraN family protein [Oscillospiraceae bacterium HV4-5-C5C]
MPVTDSGGSCPQRRSGRSKTGFQAYQNGLSAENLVCHDLRRHGITVLEQRWSAAHLGEIDIIATSQKRLMLIEVKARRLFKQTGLLANEALTARQAHRILQSGLAYIQSRQLSEYIVELWLASCQLDRTGQLLELAYYPYLVS